MTAPIRPSDLHVGDVISWTPYVPFPVARHVNARVLQVGGSTFADALVEDSGLHPGCWISDEDTDRLVIEFEYMTLPTAVALATRDGGA